MKIKSAVPDGRIRFWTSTHVTGGRGSRRRLLAEVGLWVVVGVAFVLDVQTTIAGLGQGFVESNPVMQAAFSAFGVSVLWAVKTVVVAVAVGCWLYLPRAERVLVPVSLGLPWGIAALSNAGLLVGV